MALDDHRVEERLVEPEREAERGEAREDAERTRSRARPRGAPRWQPAEEATKSGRRRRPSTSGPETRTPAPIPSERLAASSPEAERSSARRLGEGRLVRAHEHERDAERDEPDEGEREHVRLVAKPAQSPRRGDSAPSSRLQPRPPVSDRRDVCDPRGAPPPPRPAVASRAPRGRGGANGRPRRRRRSRGDPGVARRARLGARSARAPERAHFLIEQLIDKARRSGAHLPYKATTAYLNTIHVQRRGAARRASRASSTASARIMRWNALAMVVQANRESAELGGHIASFASRRDALRRRLQPLLPRRPDHSDGGDLVYIQGHCVAGHLRARVPRRPAQRGAARAASARRSAGAGSRPYPHPWLMPDFWQFPTVSMGLGPIMAIYQARFMKYLQQPRPGRRRRAARSGRSSATARWTSPSRSARSASPRARSSTT